MLLDELSFFGFQSLCDDETTYLHSAINVLVLVDEHKPLKIYPVDFFAFGVLENPMVSQKPTLFSPLFLTRSDFLSRKYSVNKYDYSAQKKDADEKPTNIKDLK